MPTNPTNSDLAREDRDCQMLDALDFQVGAIARVAGTYAADWPDLVRIAGIEKYRTGCVNITITDLDGTCPTDGFKISEILPQPRKALELKASRPVEDVEREKAIHVAAQIEMDREGTPYARTQQEFYDDAAEMVDAILAALSSLQQSEGEKAKPWCETCGVSVQEILCPKCAKWWADNSPPTTPEHERGLREPTMAMLEAGIEAGWPGEDIVYSEAFHGPEQMLCAIWKAMLSARPIEALMQSEGEG